MQLTDDVAANTLQFMRADAIPAADRGLWSVRKWNLRIPTKNPQGQTIPPGDFTALGRYTEATLHTEPVSVMSDDPVELRRHLDFVLRARGRVLLTGLGLGCVLRGLLVNPAVDWVDVVERDPDVLDLVAGHLDHDRFEIHQADAHEFLAADRSRKWTCAWHDLWADEDLDEPHLAIVHQRLILALRGRVEYQGAWAFPRHLQRLLRENFPTSGAWVRP